MRNLNRVLAIASVVAVCGCQVEWGGGQIALENPAPPAAPAGDGDEQLEPEQIPLPEGVLLYVVSLDAVGRARLTPVVELAGGDGALELKEIVIPEADDPSFRSRFDSVFLAPGTELDLLARGRRLGSLILDGPTAVDEGSCPSIAAGRALLIPGQDVPAIAFAVPRGRSGSASAARVPPLAPTSSMSLAGPVLAERLIGGDRAFLARLQSLSPVELTGDTLAGMAATWLIDDSLAVGPPGADAVSLFFMARFEPTRGFIPIWEEVRHYGDAEAKEALEFVDWIQLGTHRLDVLRRYDASSVRIAFSVTAQGEDREVSWIEPPGCGTPDRLQAR